MIDKCSETNRSDHIHKRTIEGTMGMKRGWRMKKELECDNGFRKKLIETTIPTKKELMAGIVVM